MTDTNDTKKPTSIVAIPRNIDAILYLLPCNSVASFKTPSAEVLLPEPEDIRGAQLFQYRGKHIKQIPTKNESNNSLLNALNPKPLNA